MAVSVLYDKYRLELQKKRINHLCGSRHPTNRAKSASALCITADFILCGARCFIITTANNYRWILCGPVCTEMLPFMRNVQGLNQILIIAY